MALGPDYAGLRQYVQADAGRVPNYEPEGKDSVAEIAKAEGKPPAEIVSTC